MYTLQDISTDEIVTLDEAKKYLKLQTDSDNDKIKNCITAAIELAENCLNRSLCSKTVEFKFDLGKNSKVKLPIIHAISIESAIVSDVAEKDITAECKIISNGTFIELPKGLNGSLTVIYKTAQNHLKAPIKLAILRYVSLLFDDHSLSNEAIKEFYRLCNPYRKVQL